MLGLGCEGRGFPWCCLGCRVWALLRAEGPDGRKLACVALSAGSNFGRDDGVARFPVE